MERMANSLGKMHWLAWPFFAEMVSLGCLGASHWWSDLFICVYKLHCSWGQLGPRGSAEQFELVFLNLYTHVCPSHPWFLSLPSAFVRYSTMKTINWSCIFLKATYAFSDTAPYRCAFPHPPENHYFKEQISDEFQTPLSVQETLCSSSLIKWSSLYPCWSPPEFKFRCHIEGWGARMVPVLFVIQCLAQCFAYAKFSINIFEIT